MKVLVTGAGGMLGQAATREFRERGHEVFALDRAALDVTQAQPVRDTMTELRPDVVLQCAAYADVDGAEGEPELAHRINAGGAAVVAQECQRSGALFVYPSTDYVFSGAGDAPWKPDDRPDPVNVYGESKAAGEHAALEAARALVVRTSWLYGSGGRNFVDTISRAALERDRLEVVDDQVGRPTWTGSLAHVIALLAERDARGIFHACDGGSPVSWFGFAAEILEIHGIATPLVPVKSGAFPRAAQRPCNSVLAVEETESWLGMQMPDRGSSLNRYLHSAARC